MLIEFQLKAYKFLKGFCQRLRTLPICLTDEYQIPPEYNICSDRTLVDRVEILDMTSLQFANGDETSITVQLPTGESAQIGIRRLQLVQPVIAYLVNWEDLEPANLEPAPPCLPVHVSFLFDITVQATGSGAELILSPAGVQTDIPLPDDLREQLETEFAEAVPPTSTPLDMSHLDSLTGGNLKVLNAGVSASGKFANIAIRLEFGSTTSDPVSTWKSFYDGTVPDLLFGKDWGLFVDKQALLQRLEEETTHAISKYNKSQWYDYNVFWGPIAEWSTPSNKPRVTVKVDGEKEAACVCFLFEQDVEVEIHTTIDLSVQKPDEMTVRMELSSEIHDDFSILCCALTNSLAWGIMGPHFLEGKDSEEFWAIYLTGFALLPAVFVGSLVAAANLADQFPSPQLPGMTCEDNPPVNTCRQKINLGKNPILGKLTLTELRGVSNGLVFLGTAEGVPTVQQAVLKATALEFGWMAEDICSDAGWTLVAAAQINLINTSQSGLLAPLQICEVEVVDDPPIGVAAPSQFKQYLQAGTFFAGLNHYYTFAIPENKLSAAYKANPWPLHLRVKTSAGVRLISIPAVKALTPEQKQQLELELAKDKLTQCKDWIGWWNDKVLRPKWWTDPAPLDIQVQHLWQFVATGLEAGESLGIRGVKEANLGVAMANKGLAQLSALVTPATGEPEIAILANSRADTEKILERIALPAVSVPLERNAPQNRPSQAMTATATFPPGRRLQMKQVPLVERAILQLPTPCVHMAMGRQGRLPTLLCTTRRDVRLYDLENPALPRLIHQESRKGLRGAIHWGRNLAAWGDSGLWTLARPERPVDTTPILDATTSRGHLYVLTSRSVRVYDGELRQVGEIGTDGDMYVCAAEQALMVGNAKGFVVYDLAEPSRPARVSLHALTGIRGLLRPLLPNATGHVYVRLRQGGSMVQLRPGEPPVEVAHFESDPFFVDLVHRGNLLARLHEGRRHVLLYTAGTAYTTSDGSRPLFARQ